jgi:pimeloyl-ACP methyl ester carboxylesterase
VHHVTYGAGTPLLALHGWTPDHRLMTGCLEPVFERRPGYRRLYPDLPGMGRTPAGEAANSDDILTAVLAFVDEQIGDEPFVLIGESYGGYLARAIADRRPDRVRGLGLICPIGIEVENAKRTVPDHVVIHAEPGLVADPDYLDLAVVQTAETLRRYEAEIAPGVAIADMEAIERIQPNRTLTQPPESGQPYERPTLIVCGRQDSVVGFTEQYRLLDHYPRATYAVLDRAGHNLHYEQPALFEALVTEWLDRVEEAPMV